MKLVMSKPDTPEKLIEQILNVCHGEQYIFRGESRKHELVASQLYLRYKEEFGKYKNIFPVEIEKEIVEKARWAHFSEETPIADILTDLRHFGGDTTAIDFSYNILVALFFACNGNPNEDGRLIAIPFSGIGKKFDSKNYGENKDLSLLYPSRTQNSRARVEFQSSIFIHAPRGYIDLGRPEFHCITVPKEIKQACLQHLSSYYNIRVDTIYNDLIGFIENENNWKSAQIIYISGLAKSGDRKYNEAVKDYSHSIELNPDNPAAWNSRGVAKLQLKQFDEATKDFEQAIKINPNIPDYWSNHGVANMGLELYENAIIDYDRSINLNPDNDGFLCNRGLAKFELNLYHEAIEDYDAAIHINRNNSIFWELRGRAKGQLGLHGDAVDDYNQALQLDPENYIALWGRGKSKNAMSEHEEAMRDLNLAIKIRPEFPEAWYELGVSNMKLGNRLAAIDDLKRSRDFAREQGNSEVEASAIDLLKNLEDDS